MLKKINEAEVRSTEGFKIRYGKDSMTYWENSAPISFEIEHFGNPSEMIIYLEDARKVLMRRGENGPALTECEFSLVEKRIADCLDFLGRKYSFR